MSLNQHSTNCHSLNRRVTQKNVVQIWMSCCSWLSWHCQKLPAKDWTAKWHPWCAGLELRLRRHATSNSWCTWLPLSCQLQTLHWLWRTDSRSRSACSCTCCRPARRCAVGSRTEPTDYGTRFTPYHVWIFWLPKNRLTAPWYIPNSRSVKYFICLKGLTETRTGPM